MIKNQIELSDQFKAQTSKAILAIALFLIVYLILAALAVGLTVLCVYAGIMLIISAPRFITIILGLGLASLGLLVLIFLVKFMFTKTKIDRSHLREVTEAEEPELFRMIRDIVQQVGTSLPKRVYLSADVNAAVFYDSSFWSMFFPIKKNLQIGMGLVNSVTVEELKAILAHEFGHFSQRTMKVGSYVYNVNKVIYNMLYENDSYEKLVTGWASISGYVAIFVMIAMKIVQGIQWILQKMYDLVNIRYMALSREMEFHADEIAANVTGYAPLKHSLLRLDLAGQAYSSVLNFYGDKIKENIKSRNIYPEHQFVMNYLTKEGDVPLVNELPQIAVEEQDRYNQSKLVITDQWASHPSTEERVKRLEQTNLLREDGNDQLSTTVYRDIERTQEAVTTQLFAPVEYQGEVHTLELENFKKEFVKHYLDNRFDRLYNGYYDQKNPIEFDVESVPEASDISFEDLFSVEKVALVKSATALQNDLETLTNIANKTLKIKTFDYDGKKFQQRNSKALMTELNAELQAVHQEIAAHDIRIYQYFKQLETKHRPVPKLADRYREFFAFDKVYDSNFQLYSHFLSSTQFIGQTNSVDEIREKFSALEIMEERLKDAIRELIRDERFQAEVDSDMQKNFDLYLSKKLSYFGYDSYHEGNMQVLFAAIHNFHYLFSRGYFVLKKGLLEYQVRLYYDQNNN